MSSAESQATTDRFANSTEHLLAGLAYIDLRVRWAVARARANGLNPDDEFRGLYISEEQVDALLGYDLGHHLWATGNGEEGRSNGKHPATDRSPLTWDGWSATVAEARIQWQKHTQNSLEAGVPLLLDRTVRAFDLSPTEVDVLLVALAPELDPRYERLFAYLQDDVTKKRPTVDLILNLLTDSFQEKLRMRQLFTDTGRLLKSRLLIRFGDAARREAPLLSQYVRPAAHLMEHLLGHATLDSRLATSNQLLSNEDLAPPRRVSEEFVARLIDANHSVNEPPPLFMFVGKYGAGKLEAARHIAKASGQPLLVSDLTALAASDFGLDEGVLLTLRDGQLLNASLYLREWENVLNDDQMPHGLLRQLFDYPHTIIFTGELHWQPKNGPRRRPVHQIRFHTPDYERRLQIWCHGLGRFADADALDLSQVANHFRFTPGQIEDAIATAHDIAQWRGGPLTKTDLFSASRLHSNQKLATLAAKITPHYGWGDIVLPPDTVDQLQEMINTVRQRPVVYGEWGFEQKLALGKGLNALFAGESGTGKTMAADIMAGELGLDLYKVDLSALVSKYIGETEKNLDRIFTEAATSNAILFFDEADAIFGKRSEVKDSHDRYANIEISYLLQRMETYDGVVILATNLRANLDEAFTRRLHFAVEFPFPEVSDRERIWRVNFPPETPVAADVDFRLLAERFRLAGGNIRNIILAAAFLAAETDGLVSMRHLLHAARREYQKKGRLIDEQLFTNE